MRERGRAPAERSTDGRASVAGRRRPGPDPIEVVSPAPASATVAVLGDPAGRAVDDGQTIRVLRHLQRTSGNAQVAELVQRLQRANGTALPHLQRLVAPPVPPKPMAPEQDPKFVALTGKLGKQAGAIKKHAPAKAKAAEAQKAAVPPANDKQSQAKAAQAEVMAGAKPGEFDKAGFIAAVNKAINDAAPKSLEEADNFADSGKAGAIKNQVMDKVGKGKDDSAKDVKEKSARPPDTSKAKEKEVEPMPPEKPGVAPGDPGAAAAMPSPAPAEQTNLAAGQAETDQQMADAEVTEEQLTKSNEPEFTDALKAKKEGEAHSAETPKAFREGEQQTLGATKSAAGQGAKVALSAMHGKRVSALSHVGGKKSDTKSKDEAKRAEVAGKIESIYAATKTEVEAILTGLDVKVTAAFNAGEAEARRAFEQNHKSEMEKWKDERYSGVRGKWRWLKDKVKGPPAEANAIYQRARDLYIARMNKMISAIADLVGGELTRAKARIAKGRQDIAAYVKSLPANLKKFGQEAQKNIASKFDDLDNTVNEKQESLVSDLAQKYTEARNKVDEDIKKMQEENKGLWDKAKDAIGGVIEAIKKLKDMLLNVLARAASVIGKIIRDPIGFLGNLVGAVKAGLQRFVANIADHLKKGLLGWLFGELAKAGIELPKTFDLKGIFGLILSLLGFTYNAIRGRVVRKIGRMGETVVSKMEQSVDVFKALATEGVAGLWKFVQEKLTDLKEQVLGPIKDFVIQKVIIAGITWLVSLLNPASAFIKACKAIYDVVMFFVNRAAQIGEFVNSVLDSITAIAGGGVGAVANLIENTLSKILPLVISFLASLLGLGGIGDKIRKVIEAVQKPVMKAVDFVVGGAMKLGKKLLGGLKRLGQRARERLRGRKEPEVAGNVKEEAKRRIGTLLGKATTETRVSDVIPKVLAELRPHGLRELRAQHAGDEVSVIAAASPEDLIARYVPKKPACRADVTVSVTGDPLAGISGISRAARRDAEGRIVDEQGNPITNPNEAAMVPAATFLPPAQVENAVRPRRRRGGGGVEELHKSGGIFTPPEPGSQELKVVLWNTAERQYNFDSNANHAEPQLTQWLANQTSQDWKGRVERIAIHISLSPCTMCTGDLVAVGRQIIDASRRAGAPRPTLTLTFEQMYAGKGKNVDISTTPASLSELAGVWTVSPGYSKLEPVLAKTK